MLSCTVGLALGVAKSKISSVLVVFGDGTRAGERDDHLPLLESTNSSMSLLFTKISAA